MIINDQHSDRSVASISLSCDRRHKLRENTRICDTFHLESHCIDTLRHICEYMYCQSSPAVRIHIARMSRDCHAIVVRHSCPVCQVLIFVSKQSKFAWCSHTYSANVTGHSRDSRTTLAPGMFCLQSVILVS